MEPIIRQAKNSELAVPKEKRAFLTYPADGLASCELEESEDGIALKFDAAGLEQAEAISKTSKEEKLRFLSNCADLSDLYKEYDFSISEENLTFDINLRPQVLMRDISSGAEFLPRYMALIGSILHPRYKYEDYLNGGNDLYRKNKLLNELSALETVQDVKERLLEEYRSVSQKAKETKRLVPKRNSLITRIAIPLLAVVLIGAAYFAVTSLFWDIPYRDDVIAANAAYIAGNYITVQNLLEDYELANLSDDTKYFYARASVNTEALTDAQKQNVLAGLTLKTEPVIYDYWISVGRLDFTQAIDISQRIGDDDLLLFAYLKQESIVRVDPTMTGEEKTSTLNDLERKISELTKARDDAIAAAEAEAAVIAEAERAGQRLFTNDELMQYIKDNDTGFTESDFEGLDIDDFIETCNITGNSIEGLNLEEALSVYIQNKAIEAIESIAAKEIIIADSTDGEYELFVEAFFIEIDREYELVGEQQGLDRYSISTEDGTAFLYIGRTQNIEQYVIGNDRASGVLRIYLPYGENMEIVSLPFCYSSNGKFFLAIITDNNNVNDLAWELSEIFTQDK